jgi:hypothetical protein
MYKFARKNVNDAGDEKLQKQCVFQSKNFPFRRILGWIDQPEVWLVDPPKYSPKLAYTAEPPTTKFSF